MGSVGQLVQMQRYLWDRDGREVEALYRRKLFFGRKESSVKDLHLRRVLVYCYNRNLNDSNDIIVENECALISINW